MKWYKVCAEELVPLQGSRKLINGDREVAVFRLSDGSTHAVENCCPHKNGPLSDGIVSGNTIICPLHNWKINLESGQALPPDSGCVKTYKVKV